VSDFAILVAVFAAWLIVLVVLEYRAFANGTTTISEYAHDAMFRSPLTTLWTGFGAGALLMHFATAPCPICGQ
jgi:hypothetical protein